MGPWGAGEGGGHAGRCAECAGAAHGPLRATARSCWSGRRPCRRRRHARHRLRVPLRGRELRYPRAGRWRWAGKALERTVNGLTNGLLYAFEVRARNRVGEGRARAALATPVGVPGAPATLTATAGDGEVGLAWSVPADNGGTPVTGYEYRYTAGAAVPEGTPWQSAGLIHQLTVTGLTNGLQYAFEVRARNRVGGKHGEPWPRPWGGRARLRP